MTSKQENKLTMWTTTSAVLKKYESLWKEVPAFNEAVANFINIRLELQPDTEKQTSPTTGITVDKSIQREKVVKLAAQMALNIKAYAAKAKNNHLKKQFTFAPSHFDKLRDNTFPVIIRNILTKATELAKELQNYGVKPEKIEKLETELKYYNSMNPAPRLASGDRKQATVNIAAKIKEGETELEQTDSMIGNYEEEHPNFVAAYRNARIIINLGGGKKPKNPPPPPDNKK